MAGNTSGAKLDPAASADADRFEALFWAWLRAEVSEAWQAWPAVRDYVVRGER